MGPVNHLFDSLAAPLWNEALGGTLDFGYCPGPGRSILNFTRFTHYFHLSTVFRETTLSYER